MAFCAGWEGLNACKCLFLLFQSDPCSVSNDKSSATVNPSGFSQLWSSCWLVIIGGVWSDLGFVCCGWWCGSTGSNMGWKGVQCLQEGHNWGQTNTFKQCRMQSPRVGDRHWTGSLKGSIIFSLWAQGNQSEIEFPCWLVIHSAISHAEATCRWDLAQKQGFCGPFWCNQLEFHKELVLFHNSGCRELI